MPATFLLPLPDLSELVNPVLSRAAFTALLDNCGGHWEHKPSAKPYTVSQVFMASDGKACVEISVLTDAAERALHTQVKKAGTIRFGKERTHLGKLDLVSRAEWSELAALRRKRWGIEFFTPTLFRSGNHATAFPSAGAILRAAGQTWSSFAPIIIEELSHQDSGKIDVEEFDIATVPIRLPVSGSGSKRPSAANKGNAVTLSRSSLEREAYGFIGTMSFRCEDDQVCEKVSPLFGLISYCGVGSYRNLGYGLAKLVASE